MRLRLIQTRLVLTTIQYRVICGEKYSRRQGPCEPRTNFSHANKSWLTVLIFLQFLRYILMPHSNANTALNPFNMLHFSVKNFLKHMFNKSVVLEYQKYLSNFICIINKKNPKKIAAMSLTIHFVPYMILYPSSKRIILIRKLNPFIKGK